MKYEVDCHSHSFFSPDAGESPDTLFKIAKTKKLKGLVITDHNTINQFCSTRLAAQKYKILTCEGVEITSSYKGADIHILGYAKSFNAKHLSPILNRICNGYNTRSQKTLIKLREIGIKINFLKLLKKSKSGYISKPLIAREISKLKKITQKEALLYVERGGIAYIPYGRWAPSPEVVVKSIIKAGGKAVLAHPGDFFGKRNSIPLSKRRMMFDELIKSLVMAGISGIEIWYPSHTSQQISYFKSITKKYNLISTGGSDYHGKVFTEDRSIGQRGTKLSEFLKLL